MNGSFVLVCEYAYLLAGVVTKVEAAHGGVKVISFLLNNVPQEQAWNVSSSSGVRMMHLS